MTESNHNNIDISDMDHSYKMRNILTNKDRRAVLVGYDYGRSVQSLSKEYGCCGKQIMRIIANRTEIERQFARDQTSDEERALEAKEKQRRLKIQFLDSVLLEFVQRSAYHNKPISSQLLLDMLYKVKEAIAVPNFKATNGWLRQFRERHRLTALSANELRAQFRFTEPKAQALDHMELINYVRRRDQQEKNVNSEQELLGHQEQTTIVVKLEDTMTEDATVEEVTIKSQADAMIYLRALQEYAMLQENFRAIGLLMQTEDVLINPPNRADFEVA